MNTTLWNVNGMVVIVANLLVSLGPKSVVAMDILSVLTPTPNPRQFLRRIFRPHCRVCLPLSLVGWLLLTGWEMAGVIMENTIQKSVIGTVEIAVNLRASLDQRHVVVMGISNAWTPMHNPQRRVLLRGPQNTAKWQVLNG